MTAVEVSDEAATLLTFLRKRGEQNTSGGVGYCFHEWDGPLPDDVLEQCEELHKVEGINISWNNRRFGSIVQLHEVHTKQGYSHVFEGDPGGAGGLGGMLQGPVAPSDPLPDVPEPEVEESDPIEDAELAEV